VTFEINDNYSIQLNTIRTALTVGLGALGFVGFWDKLSKESHISTVKCRILVACL